MKLQEAGMSSQELKETVEKYMIDTYERFDFIAETAKDMYLYDEKGNRYLDFYAGIAVNSTGNCNDKVVEAVKDQVEDIIHTFNYPYRQRRYKIYLLEILMNFFSYYLYLRPKYNVCRPKKGMVKYEGFYVLVPQKIVFGKESLLKLPDLLGKMGADMVMLLSGRVLESIGSMMLASTFAGIAFAWARLGNVQAMAHPLSGYIH